MSDDEPEPRDPAEQPGEPKKTIRERRPELTRWKVFLLAFAAVFVVVGLGLQAFADDSPPATSSEVESGGSGAATPPSSLVGAGRTTLPGASGSEGDETADGPGGWSPFFLKGGFSFFVAFCVGFAARVWLKIAALFLGTFFLGVFVLSYFDVLSVDWLTLEGWWDALAGWVSREAADFRTFVTGSLPQTGLAGLGLIAGFKKR